MAWRNNCAKGEVNFFNKSYFPCGWCVHANSNICLTRYNLFQDISGDPRANDEAHPRKAFTKAMQDFWKNPVSHRLDGCDTDFCTARPSDVPQVAHQLTLIALPLAHLIENDFTRGRESHAAWHAFEKGYPQLIFQLQDLPVDG
jgi:hypothetical protein